MTDTAPIPVSTSKSNPESNRSSPGDTHHPTPAQVSPPPPPPTPRNAFAAHTKTTRAMHIALAILLVTAAASTGALTAFSSLFVDGFAFHDPDDLRTLEQWSTAIGAAASNTTEIVIFAALALAAMACITTVAAWQRHPVWLPAGILSMMILLFSLLGAAANGHAQLTAIIAHTHERIGAVALVDPAHGTDGSGADHPASEPTAHPTPPLTHDEATAEIVQLVGITAALTGAPLIATNFATTEARVFTPEAPPIQYESCFPDPQQRTGTQATLNFTAPSDPDGRIARELVSSWSRAGYAPGDAQRSQHFFGDPRTPIHTASINDRYTIDGTIHVQITTWCASTPHEGTP